MRQQVRSQKYTFYNEKLRCPVACLFNEVSPPRERDNASHAAALGREQTTKRAVRARFGLDSKVVWRGFKMPWGRWKMDCVPFEMRCLFQKIYPH